jgi:hypothetical protein
MQVAREAKRQRFLTSRLGSSPWRQPPYPPHQNRSVQSKSFVSSLPLIRRYTPTAPGSTIYLVLHTAAYAGYMFVGTPGDRGLAQFIFGNRKADPRFDNALFNIETTGYPDLLREHPRAY